MQINEFVEQHYGDASKSFFLSKNFKFIDHGNHGSDAKVLKHFSGFIYSDLTLLHFHSRGYYAYKKKLDKELSSLGRDKLNISELQLLVKDNKLGTHNLIKSIEVLQGTLYTTWKRDVESKVATHNSTAMSRFFLAHRLDYL